MQGLPLVFVLNKRMADFLVSVVQQKSFASRGCFRSLSASYRRTQNPRVTKLFYGITGIQNTPITQPRNAKSLAVKADRLAVSICCFNSGSLPPNFTAAPIPAITQKTTTHISSSQYTLFGFIFISLSFFHFINLLNK